MEIIQKKKYSCENCITKFYLIDLNHPNCPKCGWRIGDRVNKISKSNSKSSSKPRTSREKISEDVQGGISSEIKDLIHSEEPLFENYQALDFEFQDKTIIRDFKANNRSGDNTIEGREWKVKSIKTGKSYEIGISFVDYWSYSDSMIFIHVNNGDSAVIQYNLTKNLEPTASRAYLCAHNGVVNAGKVIEGRIVVNYILKKDPELIIGNQINLGKILNHTENTSFEPYKNFLSRLVIYGIYLNEFKDMVREALKSDRIPVPSNLKWIILKRDEYRCKKCHSRELLQIDHIRPYSWFVRENREKEANLEANLQVLCQKCNLEKSNLHATKY